MNIGTLAYKELNKFKTDKDTNGFNQYNNILRIDKYSRGEYLSLDDDSALFWQLGTPRIPLYAKSIDMDTKNFSMIGIGKFNWFKAFIANARFRQWAIDNRLAITLDDTSDGIAKYGSMIWKKSYDKNKVLLEKVNLKNIFFDQSVENIIDSPVIELHYLSEMELRRRYPEQAGEIIKKNNKSTEGTDRTEEEESKYELAERWGEFKLEEEDVIEYRHSITSGSGDAEVVCVDDVIKTDDKGMPKEFPYFDFHGERVAGRWQAMGVIERLYGLQEQINKLVNQNDSANDIASLLLFRTVDPNTTGNLLDSAISGQIVQSQDLAQMPIDNRFINTFISQLREIEVKADSLCYINDSISGDTPPSGVPYRSLAVATRASASTFRYIKTAIGEKMGWILEKEIMPDVVREFNKEDLFDIMEDNADVRLYDEMKIDEGIKKFMKEEVKKGKTAVFEEDLAKEAGRLQKELERGGRQENLVIDFKWGIRMNPTGESVDKNTKNAAIDAALMDMSANPNLVNTPLFQQKLEMNGIPPFRLTPQEIADIQGTQGQALPEKEQPDKLSQLAEV